MTQYIVSISKGISLMTFIVLENNIWVLLLKAHIHITTHNAKITSYYVVDSNEEKQYINMIDFTFQVIDISVL